GASSLDRRRSWLHIATRRHAADAVAAQEGEAAGEPDGTPLAPGVTLEVGKNLDGTPAKASTKTSRKTATTVMTHGTAKRSVRGGSVPRYPGARGGGWLVIRRRRVPRAPSAPADVTNSEPNVG